jgi:hypothetical protein
MLWSAAAAVAVVVALALLGGGADSESRAERTHGPGWRLEDPEPIPSREGASGEGVADAKAEGSRSTVRLAGLCKRASSPAPAAFVTAHRIHFRGQTYFGGEPFSTRSDEAGRYSMNLDPGLYVLVARHDGERSPRAEVQVNGDLDFDLLISTGTRRLRIRFEGIEVVSNLAGFEVATSLEPGVVLRPDDQGICVVQGLHLGDLCTLFVAPPEGHFVRPRGKTGEYQIGRPVVLHTWIDDAMHETTVQVGRFATVRGAIDLPEALPWQQVTLEARGASGYKPRVSLDAVPGATYELPVLPGQPFALFAAGARIENSNVGLRRPVAVGALEPGEVRTVDVSMERLDGRLRGVIVDYEARPVSGALVRVIVDVASPLPSARGFVADLETRTDANGAFVIEGFPEGTVLIRTTIAKRADVADPGALQVRDLAGRSFDAGTIVARRATSIRGHVIRQGEDADPVTVIAIPRLPDGTLDHGGQHGVQTSEGGSFVLERVAPGRYAILAADALAGSDPLDVDVPETGVRGIEVRARR